MTKFFNVKKLLFAMIGLFWAVSAGATSFHRMNFACSACGKEDSYPVLMSTNQLEPSSLDGRPGEMARSAVIRVIQRCPSCGFVSYDIDKKICDKQEEIVNSDEYQNILKSEKINEYSKRYQAYAYLLEQCGKDREEIAYAYMKAAWAADDEREDKNAVQFRQKAILYYEQIPNIDVQIRLLDLYRRTAQFQKGLDLISQIKVDEKNEKACLYQGLIRHEKKLLEAEKTKDRRMLYFEYCPSQNGSEENIIDSYTDAIMILKRDHEVNEALELQQKLIPYLENKDNFRDKFILTWLYYQSNQLDKAHALEKELIMPNDWSGFFNTGYGNWYLMDIDSYLNQDNVPNTPFFRLAKDMLYIRYRAMYPDLPPLWVKKVLKYQIWVIILGGLALVTLLVHFVLVRIGKGKTKQKSQKNKSKT